jgi:hypothetical protein
MFDRICYVSRAAAGVGAREVYDIIRSAHNRNGASGLTGALVFVDGCFVQVLEGERFRLDACFERIAADPRHEALELRSRCVADQRMFPGEWMALRQRGDIAAGVLDTAGYEPGLPAARFSGAQVEAFVRAACGLTVSA